MTSGNDFFMYLEKYRVLDNQSNKLSKIYFDKILSNIKLNLETKNYINYGYIYVSVKNPQNIELFYNDFLIAKINESKDIVIPCAFEENSYLQIKGVSDEFLLMLYGANIANQNKIGLIPTKNYIFQNRGKSSVLTYDSVDSVKNGNLTEVLTIENCLDIHGFKISGNEYLACLCTNNDKLYLYTSIDNHATSIEIATGVKQAKILSDSSREQIIITYIKDNCVYFKTVSNDLSVGDETVVTFCDNSIPKSFSQIELVNYSGPTLLGINFYGDSMQVFSFNGVKFIPILTKSSTFSKININNNNIEIYTISDYLVNITKYTYLASSNLLSQFGTSYNIWNANDIIKIGDVYLVYNNGVCSEVTYDIE